MGFLGGLTGALGGFASGGPLGAVAGGLSGFLGGGADARTTNQNSQTQQSGETNATSGVNLRHWSGSEENLLDFARQAMQQGLVRGRDRDAYIARNERRYLDPMQSQIMENYRKIMGNQNSLQARGGMLGSSQAMNTSKAIGRQTAGEMGQAAAQARQLAEQSWNSAQQQQMQRMQAGMGLMGMLNQQRLAESERYNNSSFNRSGQTWGQSVAPDTSAIQGANLLASAVNDPNSHLNQNGVFGWRPNPPQSG